MQKFIILISIIALILASFVAFLFVKNKNIEKATAENVPIQKEQKTIIETRTYQNQEYGFKFDYPKNYKIKDFKWNDGDQPGGVIQTIQLTNSSQKEILVNIAKVENSDDSLAPPSGMDPFSKEEILVANQKGMNYNDGEVYTTSKDNYEFLFVAWNMEDKIIKKDLLQIVSSFTFVE
ncbi:TPA: hypothetical protein DCZ46_03950 [Candidatus Campbellbacteria bacterium]|jgi:hypothetical protein|nr:MAG: seg [Candidatus Campbellbacteria bacterium GW2011_OD1_34_28]KKP74989.1 MAG: hypothetical protein UR74_C0002G0255 [Candidatus Campbellbacteria bacterium GW2011_GWD2_35_24]KKP75875.1 MAG: hypothetical protein UR75_C0002G0256 [Candidatus Campbellbacteria bacterium GW2011_GWC2_35_28]KKP76877.1 MAG: hypothetical protein UR76_C0002G0078 [Candidatus Campbellbacteria bacterium GW2011_GWC1_35_31]KKP78803.1 MAG: hypothetical protein UR79_C0002G0078 [Candidatus Campbellbacteria bacterium GW2011_GW